MRYQRLKVAAIITLIILMGLFGGYKYIDHINTFEDMNDIKEGIVEFSGDSPLTADNAQWIAKPSDEEYHRHESDDFFSDRDSVIKYALSLAMLNRQDDFYNQFIPNVLMNDFPNLSTLPEEQEKLFNLLTRSNTLENIRFLGHNAQTAELIYQVRVELVYGDGERFRTVIALGRIGDEHGHGQQWYIANSIHDIVENIEMQ